MTMIKIYYKDSELLQIIRARKGLKKISNAVALVIREYMTKAGTWVDVPVMSEKRIKFFSHLTTPKEKTTMVSCEKIDAERVSWIRRESEGKLVSTEIMRTIINAWFV